MQSHTQEINNDAAIRAASGGAVEEGLPIGRLPHCEPGRAPTHTEVPGVGDGVTKVPDGIVPLCCPMAEQAQQQQKP